MSAAARTSATPAGDRPFAFLDARPDTKALGHAHIHRKLNRAVPIVDRNELRPGWRGGTDIKVPILRGIHSCWIRSRRRERRPVIEERIAIYILAQLEI